MTAAAQLWLATLFLLPISLIWDRPMTLPMPSVTAITAVIALAVICTALTYVIYMWLMQFTKVTHLAMIAYLVPILGLILGIVVLGERPSWRAYLGRGLILVGVMIVNGLFMPGTKGQFDEDPAISANVVFTGIVETDTRLAEIEMGGGVDGRHKPIHATVDEK